MFQFEIGLENCERNVEFVLKKKKDGTGSDIENWLYLQLKSAGNYYCHCPSTYRVKAFVWSIIKNSYRQTILVFSGIFRTMRFHWHGNLQHVRVQFRPGAMNNGANYAARFKLEPHLN